jgi:hypothetical protein
MCINSANNVPHLISIHSMSYGSEPGIIFWPVFFFCSLSLCFQAELCKLMSYRCVCIMLRRLLVMSFTDAKSSNRSPRGRCCSADACLYYTTWTDLWFLARHLELSSYFWPCVWKSVLVLTAYHILLLICMELSQNSSAVMFKVASLRPRITDRA